MSADRAAVYHALSPRARLRTSPENVADVLDALAHVTQGSAQRNPAEVPAPGPLDANALERMAKERPDERFLKGTGVLKMIAAIRQLEGELRALGTQPELVRRERMLAVFRAIQAWQGALAQPDDRVPHAQKIAMREAVRSAVYALAELPQEPIDGAARMNGGQQK